MSRGLANDIQLTVREDGDSMRSTLQAARSHIYLQTYMCEQGHEIEPNITECVKDPYSCFINNNIIEGEPILLSREDCNQCLGLPKATIELYRKSGRTVASQLDWDHAYDAERFVVFYLRRALQGWRYKYLAWERAGRVTPQSEYWTPKEQENVKLSAIKAGELSALQATQPSATELSAIKATKSSAEKAMQSKFRLVLHPQTSSARSRTAVQTKSDAQRSAKHTAGTYTWNYKEAQSAFEAAYVPYAIKIIERRRAQHSEASLQRMDASDRLDILKHVAKELQKSFKDELLPPEFQRTFTEGTHLGNAGRSDDSHAQGSTAKKTFQTTINPKEGRRLEDILDRYPPGYNSEGGSGFSGMSSPETKSPSASELESDKRKGKAKAKATHSSPNDSAHGSSPSDNEYHPGDFLTEEAERTERRQQARVAERNQEAARMHMEENRIRMGAARQQPYIQSNLQPQQPPITNNQSYYDMMNQDFTTHHWAVGRSKNDEIHAEPQPPDTGEQSSMLCSGKTVAAGKQRAAKTDNSAIPRGRKNTKEGNKTHYLQRMADDIANQNTWAHSDDKESFVRSYVEEAIKEEDNQKGTTANGRRILWKQENHDRILDRLRRRSGLRMDPNNFVSITVDYRGHRTGYATRPVKVANPNNHPTVKTYPPGYDSPGSSNPPSTPPITKSPPLPTRGLSPSDDREYWAKNPTPHSWALNRPNNDDLSAVSSPKSPREQSPAPRSSGTLPHVANQSPTSRGTGNEQRSRATSKTSSKGSSDGSAFMADVFDFSAASTHTLPRSTGAPQPIPASHAQNVGPSTHTTAGKAPTTAGKTTSTAGKTPASQKTAAASKRPTESSASRSSVKEDKGKNSLKSTAPSSGPKEDKGKKPKKK
ncbi:hypothetical protein IG631_22281 [Alternaria alternata]|nr:hypothetical protein IG631_22281 [Alternaria alternata]